MPIAVRDLRRTEADLVVQVLQRETLEAVESLRDGAVDLAVIHHMPGAAVPPTNDMERHRLLTDELRVVLPERHRLARHERVRLADLEGEPLLTPRRDTPAGRFRSIVEHLCAEAGFTPRVAYEVDDLGAAQAFAAAGIAVVLMHDLTIAASTPGIAVRPLADAAAGSRTVEAVVPSGPRPTPVAELVRHLARSARR